MAGLLALLVGLALWRLADEWATTPDRTNLYTFVTAIGGVVVFEFLRFALTVRRRHRRAVEHQFRLRDVRSEQVSQLLEEVAASRQALEAVEAAIEVRVREQDLRSRRNRARRVLDELTAEFDAIKAEERLLGVAPEELELTQESARRLEHALARLEPPDRRGATLLEETLKGLPLGTGPVLAAMVHYFVRESERRRHMRLKTTANEHLGNDQGRDG